MISPVLLFKEIRDQLWSAWDSYDDSMPDREPEELVPRMLRLDKNNSYRDIGIDIGWHTWNINGCIYQEVPAPEQPFQAYAFPRITPATTIPPVARLLSRKDPNILLP